MSGRQAVIDHATRPGAGGRAPIYARALHPHSTPATPALGCLRTMPPSIGNPSPDVEATVRESSRPPAVGAGSGFPEGSQVAGRFLVNRALGRGSSGEVLAVQDLSLDREVAMKVLRGGGGPAIARFMREARITARLDHPNVPPVHALEFLADGGLLFTMRKLEGLTLGEAIRRAAVGETPPAISGVNAVVNLALRVGEALSRAHFLGVIHCDIKPDNIMLGDHGEVALVDWGECRLVDEPPAAGGSTVGTPAYMSPEQARGEPPDQGSDIYAFGATLFHVLTGQLPTFDAEPERFWDKKRRGVIDPLPPEVLARIPRPLLAIVMRALAADPAGRYPEIGRMTADLASFQAGQAVAAYREGRLERTLRWLRRHRGAVAATAAILAVCLVSGGLLWREHQRQLADWGEPVVSEDFTDESWRQRWTEVVPGQWRRHSGRLETTGKEGNHLVLKQVLARAVAIEYDGESDPAQQAGDLSVFWNEDLDVGPGRPPSLVSNGLRNYAIQVAAFSNSQCRIAKTTQDSLDQALLQLSPGVRYRIRVELEGARLGLWIDGRQVLQAVETLPIGVGRLSLYGHYPGKRFGRIRVFQKRLPEVVPVLAIGDASFDRGRYAEAATAYRQVMESHPGTSLADEACFRRGLVERLAGNHAGMAAAWSTLPAGKLTDRVQAFRIEDHIAAGRDAHAADLLADLWHRQPDLRSQLRGILKVWMLRLRQSDLTPADEQVAERVLELKLRRLPPDPGSDDGCAQLLLCLGRLEEAMRVAGDNVVISDQALLRLGRGEELLRRFPTAFGVRASALYDLGRIEEALATPNLAGWRWTVILCGTGRAEEVLRLAPDTPDALRALGRFEEALASAPDPRSRAIALAALGRFDEALLVAPPIILPDLQRLAGRTDPRLGGTAGQFTALSWRLVELTRSGDLALRDAVRARLCAAWPDWSLWIGYAIIDPMLSGDAGLLRLRLEEMLRLGGTVASQRPAHLARFALGQCDVAELRGMPTVAEVELWLAVGRALRARLAGQEAAERQAWQALLALPWQQRVVGSVLPDPGLEALARYLAEDRP